jgi:hypothetical protein
MENQRLIDAILADERPMAPAHAEWYVRVLPGAVVARLLAAAEGRPDATAFLSQGFYRELSR